MKRRDILKTGLALGTGLFVSMDGAASSADKTDEIHVALIGVGLQGRALINAAMLLKNVRFRTICDIWEYARNYGTYYLKNYGHQVTAYADYREMLEKEKDLDAVIVASPDFVHAAQANACLEAGLPVYCETMMAHTLDAAKSMADTMKKTGTLLQIGYQRRSNPRYLHAKKLLGARLTGRVAHVRASWSHRIEPKRGWPRRYLIPDEELVRHGFANMHEFRNWRWYRRYSGGLFGNFGAPQVDVINWFLNATPRLLWATGSVPEADNRWHDNVLAVLGYDTPDGVVQASCQVLTSTRADGSGSHALFAGPDGSIQISQNPKSTVVYRDPDAPDWAGWIDRGDLQEVSKERTHRTKPGQNEVSETGEVSRYALPVELDTPVCHPHLANFFETIRGEATLNCPGDVALLAETSAHQAIQAISPPL